MLRIFKRITHQMVLSLFFCLLIAGSVQADVELIGYGVESNDPAYYAEAPLAPVWKVFRIRAINSGIPDYFRVYLWNINNNPINEIGFAVYKDQNGHIGNIAAWGYISNYDWSSIGASNYHEFIFSEIYEDIVKDNYYWLTFQASGEDNVFISRGRVAVCPDAVDRYGTNLNTVPCCENPPQASDFLVNYNPGCYGWQVFSSDTERHRLKVLKTGNGIGTVRASGLNCQASECNGLYRLDTNVTITAQPTPPSLFSGWGGCDQVVADECRVVMNRDITVTATFIRPAQVSVKPKTLNFGSVKKGIASETKTFQASNVGSSELIINAIQFEPDTGEFSSSTVCPSLGPGETCDIGVTITPSDFGKRSAAISLYTNDPRQQSVAVKLQANAKPPKIKVKPKRINFGQVIIENETTKNIRIENRGLSDLTGLGISVVNSEGSYTVNNACPSTLPYQVWCDIKITFNPLGEGQKTDTILITSSDPKKQSVTVNITGQSKQ